MSIQLKDYQIATKLRSRICDALFNKYIKALLLAGLSSHSLHANEIILSDSYNTGEVGLSAPFSGVVSPDEEHLYVTTFAKEGSGGIAALQLITKSDSTKGDIDGVINVQKNSVNGSGGLAGAWDVVITQNGKNVYVTGADDNSIIHYQREINDNDKSSYGDLKQPTRYKANDNGPAELLSPRGMALSHDGKHLAVAAHDGNALIQFEINDSGALVNPVTIVDFTELNGKLVSGLSGATDVIYSADDRNIYVTSLEDSAVAIFSRDNRLEIPNEDSATSTETPSIPNDKFGDLKFINSIDLTEIAALDRAYSIALDQEKNVYVSSFVDGALVHFQRDLRQTVIVEEEKLIGEGPETELVSVEKPNTDFGNLVYISSTSYAKEGEDSELGLSSIMLDKEKAFLFTSFTPNKSIQVYRREMLSGRLHAVQKISHTEGLTDALKAVSSMTMSPGGDSFYVFDNTNKAIGHYQLLKAGDLALKEKSITQGEITIDLSSEASKNSIETSKENSKINLLPDSFFTMQFDVSNISDKAIENVMIAANFPTNVEVSAADIAGEACEILNLHILCSVAELSPDESIVVELSASAVNTGKLNISAEIFSALRETNYNNNVLEKEIIVNTPPVATADIIVDYSQQVNILENDTDADSHSLSLFNVDENTEKGGSVQFNKGGKFILYNAPDEFDGEDSFNYTIVDELGAQAVGIVRIASKGVIQSPDDDPGIGNNEASDDNWFGSVDLLSLLLITTFMGFIRKIIFKNPELL